MSSLERGVITKEGQLVREAERLRRELEATMTATRGTGLQLRGFWTVLTRQAPPRIRRGLAAHKRIRILWR